jgi:hypothetical protein
MSKPELPRLTSASQISNRPVELPDEWVPVPELGVSVRVCGLSGKQIEKWEAGNVRTRGGRVVGLNLDSSTRRLLAEAIQDEQGRPIYTVQTIEDLMVRAGKSVKKLENTARRLSGLAVAEDDEESDESDGGRDSARGNGVAGHPGTTSITASPSLLADAPAMNS